MGIFDTTKNLIKTALDQRLERYDAQPALVTGVPETLEKAMKEDGYGRKGLMFDPFFDQGYSGGLYRSKGAGTGFISNFLLKVVSRKDPVVSTIIHVRSNQVSSFCRRPANRFDTGFKVETNDGFDPDEEEVKEIEEFMLNCGDKENRSEDDKLTFERWGYMVTHDMITYGHTAIEMIRDRGGSLHCFLPLPAETMFYANKNLLSGQQVDSAVDAYKQVIEASHRGTPIVDGDEKRNDEEYEFLQVINGKVVEGFYHDELVFGKIYDLTEIDLNGYAMGPLERAISMITAHLQIENHQKMFFTHGVASRGLLVIQGDVTPNKLRELQAQWTNQVTGAASAWRTPILAGIKGVQWEPLTIANRDMEYAAYQDHVLRTIHACFAIDPEETGYGYLSKGQSQKALSESSNEWKVTASRDRGLRPIIGRLEAIVNEQILPAWKKEFAEKYKVIFVGLDAEDRMQEVERLQAEVTLHTTVDEAREQADLEPIKTGGGLILNPLLLQTLQANMYKGEFMEKFCGVAGASANPDLQYVPDPLWFQWQQLQMQMLQQQAAAQADAMGEGGDPNDPDGGGDEGPPGEGGEKKKAPPKKGGGEKKGPPQAGGGNAQPSPEEQQALQEQQSMMMQAQGQAVDQYISANPHLFKSAQENLAKSKIYVDHASKMRTDLEKEWQKASQRLIKDIFKAVADDVTGRDEAHEDDQVDVAVKKNDGTQS